MWRTPRRAESRLTRKKRGWRNLRRIWMPQPSSPSGNGHFCSPHAPLPPSSMASIPIRCQVGEHIDRRLRPGTAERGARGKDELQVFVRFLVPEDPFGDLEQPAKLDQARDAARIGAWKVSSPTQRKRSAPTGSRRRRRAGSRFPRGCEPRALRVRRGGVRRAA